MNILVTGDKGFIGQNLTRYLGINTKYKVTGMDIKDGKDINDIDTCLLLTKGVDCIVHLAALPGVQQSFDNPWKTFRTNVIGTSNIIDAAIVNNVGKIILASSGAADNRSSSPYAMSKWLAEYAIQISSIGSVILRFTNVYGPYSEEKTSLVHAVIKALKNGKQVDVYGDGSHSRDFIYVGDVCRAIDLAMLSYDKYNLPIDIGTGKATSVMNVIRALTSISGVQPVINTQQARREQASVVGDTNRALMEFGFRAEIELYEGLSATWKGCN